MPHDLQVALMMFQSTLPVKDSMIFITSLHQLFFFTNPLKTGKYVGILTTKIQSLQLCEVEVYSRGNFSLTLYTKLNVM